MIYLDYNATTPVLPEVLEAMIPYFTTQWSNPSSTYKFGYKIKTAIERAREQVADLIGAHPMEIIFTSCATESNNAAIHAALKANPDKRHIVTSVVEHSSVLNYCKALETALRVCLWTGRDCLTSLTWKTPSSTRPLSFRSCPSPLERPITASQPRICSSTLMIVVQRSLAGI